MAKPWTMRAKFRLTLRERLSLLAGTPLVVTFTAPEGKCNTSCELAAEPSSEPMGERP